LRYPHKLFFRLSEDDKRILEMISRYTGLPKATVMRLALKEFFRNALQEEMPRSLKKELLFYQVNEKLREIKRFRWLGHARITAEKVVREFEEYLRALEEGKVKVRDVERAKARAFKLMEMEKELLRIIEELEGLLNEG